jgi:hypothetical protein
LADLILGDLGNFFKILGTSWQFLRPTWHANLGNWVCLGMMNEMNRHWLLLLIACLFVTFTATACEVEQLSPVLYKGPEPNVALMKRLKKMGVKTILSARLNPKERKAEQARKLGLNWIHMKTGLFIAPREPEINEFLAIVDNPKNHPIYLTCSLGADRTGFYKGIYRMARQDWPLDKSVAELHQGFSKWWKLWYAFYYYQEELQFFQERENIRKALVHKDDVNVNANKDDQDIHKAVSGELKMDVKALKAGANGPFTTGQN